MSEHSSVHVELSRNTERSDPVLNHLVTVTDRHQVGALADRLAALRDWLQDDLEDLDTAIGRWSYGQPPISPGMRLDISWTFQESECAHSA